MAVCRWRPGTAEMEPDPIRDATGAAAKLDLESRRADEALVSRQTTSLAVALGAFAGGRRVC